VLEHISFLSWFSNLIFLSFLVSSGKKSHESTQKPAQKMQLNYILYIIMEENVSQNGDSQLTVSKPDAINKPHSFLLTCVQHLKTFFEVILGKVHTRRQ
jgi:hypothetical protein